MSSKAEAVFVAAAELSETEQVELIKALLLHMDEEEAADPAAIADAWRKEVQRRSQELRTGAVQPVPLADVLAEAEQILEAQD